MRGALGAGRGGEVDRECGVAVRVQRGAGAPIALDLKNKFGFVVRPLSLGGRVLLPVPGGANGDGFLVGVVPVPPTTRVRVGRPQ